MKIKVQLKYSVLLTLMASTKDFERSEPSPQNLNIYKYLNSDYITETLEIIYLLCNVYLFEALIYNWSKNPWIQTIKSYHEYRRLKLTVALDKKAFRVVRHINHSTQLDVI